MNPRLDGIIESIAQRIPHAKLKEAFASLTETYRGERKGPVRILTEEERIVYTIIRMPATLAAIREALTRLREHWNGEVRSILDLGAGPGTATVAALDTFDSLGSATLIERDAGFLALARAVVGELVGTSIQVDYRTADLASDWGGLRPTSDLVVLSYALNEMNEGAREALLRAAWEATGGALLIVEPGTPTGFANILAAREMILALGGQLAAPCPGNTPCPFASKEKDWCHFPIRLDRSRLHRSLKGGSLGWEDEKFSYLAFVREGAKPAQARIIGEPRSSKVDARLPVCHDGLYDEKVISSRDKETYKKTKKKNWGDSV